MYKAIVFAGTTEGYALCEFLAENHVPVYACAATEYGGSLLKENEFLHVSAGRLKTEDMEELFRREAPPDDRSGCHSSLCGRGDKKLIPVCL